MKKNILLPVISGSVVLFLCACTAAKLEARLEANPQCKEVINPKTGSLMPCPGSDRAFYVAAGLEEPRKPKSAPLAAASTNGQTSESSVVPPNAPSKSSPVATNAMTPNAQSDCKPKLHQKTGGILPCPPLD